MYDVRRGVPERPLPPGESRPRGSLLPVAVVTFSILGLVAMLAVFFGRAGLLMAGVVAALLAIPLLHYVTWGWWLSSALRDEEQASGEKK